MAGYLKCECGSDKQEWECDDDETPADEPEGRMVCGACNKALRSDRYDGTRFVNIYEVNRGYGGREEGGWWYDYGVVVKSFPVPSGDKDEVQAKIAEATKLVDEWNNDGANHDISSVNCIGQYRCWSEDHPGRDFPDRKPHYE